ncbi:MAG: UvrD-helicase domain-containing protein [Bacteroidales bacterium]|nr:UvrD-helicase domain-containing protein [Bacteroidales bacterium]
MSDILQHLNKEQKMAVEAVEGPVMVIAGAGSGKTRVLTYRVAHLLNMGIDPFNILALTFTNKAAREMKDRIIKLVGNADAKNVWMGTFHSVFARILRIEAGRIGYPSNFSIYDSDDSKRLMKAILKENNVNDKVYTPNLVLNRISSAKTNLITADEYLANDQLKLQDDMSAKPMLGQLYKIYDTRCKRASAMDFDDLLLNTYLMLKRFPDLLLKYQHKFSFVLVDEYQDTNHAQYMILKMLSANDENLCVVGDDAQSIYAFRGANIQNILNFKRDYPDAREFKLEQNYRSTKSIVKAANSIIVNNKDQIFKEIWTDNDQGDRITLIKANSDGEEGSLVANSIFENKMNLQINNDAFAILYRTNAQSRSIEEALRRLNIPYRIYGGLSFYNRKEIKDLLAYFRICVNHKDEEALRRIINYPTRGIGKTTQENIVVVADKAGVSQWEVLENPHRFALNVNSGTLNRINAFVTMIKSFAVHVKQKNAYEVARLIATSSGIIKELREDSTPEGISRLENIEELLNAIKEYSEQGTELVPGQEDKEEQTSLRTLDLFLQEVALITDADTKDKDDADKVSLMTIHAAKGLEFPYVYLVGLEENLFPSIQSLNSRADLEEERRLFYVAITRAEKRLYISYAENRYRWGNLTICEPSRFIEEIDQACLEYPQRMRSQPIASEKAVQPKSFKPSVKNLTKMNSQNIGGAYDKDIADKIQPGVEVEHARFGRGKVIGVDGAGASKKAAVFFKSVGQKQLLLKYAKLKILN